MGYDRDYDTLAADIAKSEGNGDLAHALHQLSQVKAKLAEADERIAWLDCGFEQAMADTRAAEARIAHLENHIEVVAKDTHKIMVAYATAHAAVRGAALTLEDAYWSREVTPTPTATELMARIQTGEKE